MELTPFVLKRAESIVGGGQTYRDHVEIHDNRKKK